MEKKARCTALKDSIQDNGQSNMTKGDIPQLIMTSGSAHS